MTDAEVLRTLTPDTRDAVKRLLSRAKALGLSATLFEGKRSCARQAALYAQGRTTEGAVVTWAQGCRSWHMFGRAVDLYLDSERCADYEPLGVYWESLGGNWGGRFSTPDCVHFELPHPDYSISELCPDPNDCENAIAKAPGASIPFWPFLLGIAAGALFARAYAPRLPG